MAFEPAIPPEPYEPGNDAGRTEEARRQLTKAEAGDSGAAQKLDAVRKK
jgi:hypothetical protein